MCILTVMSSLHTHAHLHILTPTPLSRSLSLLSLLLSLFLSHSRAQLFMATNSVRESKLSAWPLALWGKVLTPGIPSMLWALRLLMLERKSQLREESWCSKSQTVSIRLMMSYIVCTCIYLCVNPWCVSYLCDIHNVSLLRWPTCTCTLFLSGPYTGGFKGVPTFCGHAHFFDDHFQLESRLVLVHCTLDTNAYSTKLYQAILSRFSLPILAIWSTVWLNPPFMWSA